MTARARTSFLSLLFLLPACAAADRAGLYSNAGINQMPRSLDDLKLVKTDARLAEITTPVFGDYSIIRYETTSSGIPLIADSATRRTVVIVLDQSLPRPGKYEIGKGLLAAYLTAGPPSMPVGTYCLGMATRGFVEIQAKNGNLYDADFDLSFSETSAADFKDVCQDERIVESVRDLRQADLQRLAPAAEKPPTVQ